MAESRAAGAVAARADFVARLNRVLPTRETGRGIVRDYLIGRDQPVADNATAKGCARNRRVEIILTGDPVAGT